MCRAVTCRRCGKTTWAGCGRHVDQVMSGVPPQQRCRCARSAADSGAAPTPSAPGGLLGRLFGR